MIKKLLLASILVSLFFQTTSFPLSQVEKQKSSQNKLLKKQITINNKNRNKILKEMNSYLREINKQLQFGSKTEIDIPIDIKLIEQVNKIETVHSKKKSIQPVCAFINADNVNIRSEGTIKSKPIGKVFFREKLELIAQTDYKETINSLTARWILIRRDNKTEGWVFGAFLQKEFPKEDTSSLNKKRSKSKKLSIPLVGKLTSKFGYRVHPVTKRRYTFHAGIDIAAPSGTPVKASASGVVKKSGFYRNGYGNLIIIEHEKGLTTFYGHLSARLVKKGQRIKKGDIIGRVGSTGTATGPHLHFEVRRGEKSLDPQVFLR